MKQALSIVAIVAFFSCKNESGVTPEPIDTATVAATAPAMPEMAYPVGRLHWEIGDPNNIKTVLDLYKAWDNGDLSKVIDQFADTLYLRIPEEKGEISLPKDKINQALKDNRNTYKDAVNELLSATSLKCTDTGEEWVMVTTYNKWTESNGKKGQLLYHDDWLLVDGKVKYLVSFDKIPTRELLKNISQ